MIGPSDSSFDIEVSSVNTIEVPGQDARSLFFRTYSCPPVLRHGQQTANDKCYLNDQQENQQTQGEIRVDTKQRVLGVYGEKKNIVRYRKERKGTSK